MTQARTAPKPPLSQFGDSLLQKFECLSTIEDVESVEVNYFEDFLEGKGASIIPSLMCVSSSNKKQPPPQSSERSIASKSVFTEDTAINTSNEDSFISQDHGTAGEFGGCLNGKFMACRSKSCDDEYQEDEDRDSDLEEEYNSDNDENTDDDTYGGETLLTADTKETNHSKESNSNGSWMPASVTNAWENVVSLPSNFQCGWQQGDHTSPIITDPELTPRHYSGKDGNSKKKSKSYTRNNRARKEKMKKKKDNNLSFEGMHMKDSSFCVDSLDGMASEASSRASSSIIEKRGREMMSSKKKTRETATPAFAMEDNLPIPNKTFTSSRSSSSRNSFLDGPIVGRQLFSCDTMMGAKPSFGNDSQSTQMTNNCNNYSEQEPYKLGVPIINDDDFHFAAEYLSEDDHDDEEKVHKLADGGEEDSDIVARAKKQGKAGRNKRYGRSGSGKSEISF